MTSWQNEALFHRLISVKLSSEVAGQLAKGAALSGWFELKVLTRTERWDYKDERSWAAMGVA